MSRFGVLYTFFKFKIFLIFFNCGKTCKEREKFIRFIISTNFGESDAPKRPKKFVYGLHVRFGHVI